MTPDAVVFPGQGAQRRGMGQDFHRRWEVARATFAEASDAIGVDVAAICFDGDPRLNLTEFTQPCVLTAEIAAYRVAVAEFGFAPELFGGHSLGEYTALVAAGALPFADAVSLVRARGRLMQDAVPVGAGAMAALLLTDVEASPALRIAVAAGAEVVNHNSPDQVVIGGAAQSVERAKAMLAKALPELTFVPLRVSAPFHSTLMRPVEDEFSARLAECRLEPWRAAAVTSNHTGGFHEPADLADNLVRQIAGRVRWSDNMRALTGRAGRICEIGPGNALTKFFAAMGCTTTTVSTAAHAEERLPGLATAAKHPAVAAPVPAAATSSTAGEIALGDAGFRRAHNTRLAYAAGGMRMGISSPRFVIRLARAGLLGFLGTAGLDLEQVEAAIGEVRSALPPDAPWGVNVLHDPYDPLFTTALVELLLRTGVRLIEVSGFATPTPDLVRYRLSGNRLLVKVSRPDVAASFMDPPPPSIVRRLREQGLITDEQAESAATTPLADDICAEADAHAAFSLLPAVLRVRDDHRGPGRARIGLAGGLGTPRAVAAAFLMGADFVVTGSVNQCTVEAETSDHVKDLLATAGVEDFTVAPAAEGLEHGGRVSVLRRGSLFPGRSARLYESYLRDDLAGHEGVEEDYFGRSLDAVWSEVSAAYAGRDPGWQAGSRVRRALTLRWYLTDTVRRARDGDPDQLNFQVQSGPSVAAFNADVRGTALADWRARHVDTLAWHLMQGAAGVLGGRG